MTEREKMLASTSVINGIKSRYATNRIRKIKQILVCSGALQCAQARKTSKYTHPPTPPDTIRPTPGSYRQRMTSRFAYRTLRQPPFPFPTFTSGPAGLSGISLAPPTPLNFLEIEIVAPPLRDGTKRWVTPALPGKGLCGLIKPSLSLT